MTESKICTCPSGDGSLRWPCPAHPAVERAGGDERAADEKPRATRCPDCGEHDLMPGDLCACGYETDPATGYACSECDGSGEGCVGEVCRECDGSGWFVTPDQARAALAQPSLASVCATPAGENCPGDGVKSCKKCPEADRPEVVGYLATAEHPKHGQPHKAFNYFKDQHDAQVAHWRERGCEVSEDELMTVTQHARIVGALRADRDSWAEQAEQRLADWDEMRKERDAALARVAELERQEPVAWGAFHFGGERDGKLYTHCETEAQIEAYILDMHRSSDSLTLRKSPLYAAPVAQAQHSVPEGLALIPVRETEAMHDAVMALLYKGVARTDTQKLLDAYIAAAPGKEVGHE